MVSAARYVAHAVVHRGGRRGAAGGRPARPRRGGPRRRHEAGLGRAPDPGRPAARHHGDVRGGRARGRRPGRRRPGGYAGQRAAGHGRRRRPAARPRRPRRRPRPSAARSRSARAGRAGCSTAPPATCSSASPSCAPTAWSPRPAAGSSRTSPATTSASCSPAPSAPSASSPRPTFRLHPLPAARRRRHRRAAPTPRRPAGPHWRCSARRSCPRAVELDQAVDGRGPGRRAARGRRGRRGRPHRAPCSSCSVRAPATATPCPDGFGRLPFEADGHRPEGDHGSDRCRAGAGRLPPAGRRARRARSPRAAPRPASCTSGWPLTPTPDAVAARRAGAARGDGAVRRDRHRAHGAARGARPGRPVGSGARAWS